MTHSGGLGFQEHTDTPVAMMRLPHAFSQSIPDGDGSSWSLDNQAQQQLETQLQDEDEWMMYNETREENLLDDLAMDYDEKYWRYEHDEFLMNYTGPDEQLQMERDDLIYERWAHSCSVKHPDELYDDFYFRNLDPFELDDDCEVGPMPPEDYTDDFISDWYEESGVPPHGLAAGSTAAEG